MNILLEVNIKERLPDEEGIYLVKTERPICKGIYKTTAIFQTRFFKHKDPKKSRWDVSNQTVINWYEEMEQ